MITATKQTSFERERNIEAGSPLTRGEVEQETPEQKEERIERDLEAGKRAPAPEKVDITRSTVTPDQVRAQEEAAPRAIRPQTEQKGKKDAKSAASSHVEDNDLEDHTVEELRGIAHDEGAELHGASTKADIIKAIKKNRKK